MTDTTQPPDELSREERNAIRTLHNLARRWPATLWLFSAAGSLHVMKTGPDGERVKLRDCSNDPAYLVDTIKISNDGGDW